MMSSLINDTKIGVVIDSLEGCLRIELYLDQMGKCVE